MSRALISSFVYLATATTANCDLCRECDCFVFGSDAVHSSPIRTSGTSPEHDRDEHAVADEVTPAHYFLAVGAGGYGFASLIA